MNDIVNSSPFGGTSTAELDAFQQEIGLELPDDYRNYLLEHNGGMPRKFCFNTQPNPGEFLDITDLFTMARDPKDLSLKGQWNAADGYDLRQHEDELIDFIAIGYATGGTGIWLNSKTGAVFFYEPDHEEIEPGGSILEKLEFVASSFRKFIANLKSEEEAEELEDDE